MSTLIRALTYTDKSNLDEFTIDNKLNEELYSAYLKYNGNSGYRWKNSPETTFNEVYYQCTRVYNDSHPETDVYYEYMNDAMGMVGTRYASNMVFSMVNAIFTIMENPPNNVKRFQAALYAQLKDDTCYFQQFQDFATDYIETFGNVKLEFPFCPIPPDRLDYSQYDWQNVTKDFDEYTMRKFVERYTGKEDKLLLIQKMEAAFDAIVDEKANPKYDLPF